MDNLSDVNFSYFETINKIVSDLYNDELPLHNRAIHFFNMLMELIYFDKATILFFTKSANETYDKHSSISMNWDNEYVKRHYDQYYCHTDDTLPVMDQGSPVIFRSSTFFNHELRKETTYWKEYLVPNNCIYSVEGNLSIKSNKNLKGGFCFYRGAEKSDFTEQDLRIIKFFQPHLSNIFKYYGNEADSSSIIFMLDNYSYVGLGMLDKQYSIIRCNNSFQKFLDGENSYDIQSKIKQLCRNLTNGTSNKISMEYKFDETPIFLEVSKVPNATEKDESQFSCMIYDISYFFNHTLNQAKETYALTPREFDIVQAVLKGRSNEEIAKELYLSLPTVKKYLASIYSKMEIKNQKQIFEKLKLL